MAKLKWCMQNGPAHNNWKIQGVALTGRNSTGPPCNVTVELQLDWRLHDIIAGPTQVKPPASPPQCYSRQMTTTDAREQNNTGSLHYV